MTHVPNWWQFALLALAAFRLTRLGSYDDLTIPLRRYVTGMGDEEHHQWAHVIETLEGQGIDLREEPYATLDNIQLHWAKLTGEAVLPRLVSDAARWTPKRRMTPTGWNEEGYYAAPIPPVSYWRFYLSKLIHCAWCAGFWLSLLVWLAWLAWPHAVLIVSVPFALSAIVGLTAKNLDA